MSDNKWILIIGGSSGVGYACAKKLASLNYNIVIVHRDTRSAINNIEKEFDELRSLGAQLITVNTNATTNEGRNKVIENIKSNFKENDKITAMVFSIADGNLKPLLLDDKSKELDTLTEDELFYTISAMGTSFFEWSKLLLDQKLFADPARIIGITSEGGEKVLPYYAAVSMAKSVMESASRQIAVDLASMNITSNIINAGIMDTPALRAIPDNEAIIANALRRNPYKKLTTPKDIANAVYLLTLEESAWINGEIIRVDGGEQIVY